VFTVVAKPFVEAPPPPEGEDVVDYESPAGEGVGDVVSRVVGDAEGGDAQAVPGGGGGGGGGEGGEGGGAVDDKQGKKDDRLAFLMLEPFKTKVRAASRDPMNTQQYKN